MFRDDLDVLLIDKVDRTTQLEYRMRQLLARTAIFGVPVAVFAACSSASAYTIYSAEQPWSGGPPWPAIPFASGVAVESAFISSLSSPVLTDTLDGLSSGSPAGQSLFGGLAQITQSSITVPALYPDWCYSGSRCLEKIAGPPPYGTPNPLFTLVFGQPVDAFGFWANHQNSYDNKITVKINGGSVVLGPSAVTGASSFYGFVASDPSEWITTLDFFTSNEYQGYLYFDQFSTSRADVPGPVPAGATAMAIGWSRHLRRRIQSCTRVSDSQ